jgi:hypothetical protein
LIHEAIIVVLCPAIRGKVVKIDEKETWIYYEIKVEKVIRQGNSILKTDEEIRFQKRDLCLYPDLGFNDKVLIMGSDKNGQHNLDKSTFVRKLTDRQDFRNVNKLAKRITNGECN